MARWKTINGFEDYEISDDGRVRNGTTGRVLRTTYRNMRGETVGLRKNGRTYFKLIHRLVAEAFIEESDRDGSLVTHKDNDINNNVVDNLEYSTRSRIIKRSYDEGRKVPRNKGRRILVVETGKIYNSIAECSRDIGLSKSSISKCLNYRFYNNRLGYHFEEVD